MFNPDTFYLQAIEDRNALLEEKEQRELSDEEEPKWQPDEDSFKDR